MFGNIHDISFPDLLFTIIHAYPLNAIAIQKLQILKKGVYFDSFLVEIKPRLSANATSSSQERIKRLEHDNCLPYKETIFITFILFKWQNQRTWRISLLWSLFG